VDDNTAKVLIAVAGLAGGLITGVVVAALGYRFTRATERDRQRHESRVRWLAERRSLYGRFILAASEVQSEMLGRIDDQGRQAEPHPPIDRTSVEAVHQELRLMAPEATLDIVSTLYAHLLTGTTLVEGEADDSDSDGMPEARRAVRAELGPSWEAMIKTLREDLEVGPDPASARG
jgi:hypothetical protein